MRECDTCQDKKPDSEFRKVGRGRKKTCQACEGAPVTATESGDGETPKPIASFTLFAGHSCDVEMVEGLLTLKQLREEDGTQYLHEVQLLPFQARQLIDKVAGLLGVSS